MGRIHAIVNQKGGVGKTTTAVNVAAYMAAMGARILLIDIDPQGNATTGLGISKLNLLNTTYRVILGEVTAEQAIVNTKVANLDLMPATLDLAGAELELIARISRETCLRNAIAGVATGYDHVIIDTPPSLGLLTLNALVAADGAIVPMQCEFYAMEGVGQLIRTIDLVKQHLNPELVIRMVILTMVDNRMRLTQQAAEDIRRFFGSRVAKTQIPRNVRLSEAPSHGEPILLYDAGSRGAIAYRSLAEEVLSLG